MHVTVKLPDADVIAETANALGVMVPNTLPGPGVVASMHVVEHASVTDPGAEA